MSGRSIRPLPEGFAEYAAAHTVNEVRKHFTLSWKTYQRFCNEVAVSRPALRRPMPADFTEYAARETSKELARRYTSSHETIARWRREAGIVRMRPPPPCKGRGAPCPDDIATTCLRLSRPQLARHYGVTEGVVARWLTERGLKTFQAGYRTPKITSAPQPQRDGSLAGQAARHLQSLRIIPVVRAAVIDPKRTGYVVGTRSMATEDMISLAISKGFDPGAWSRVSQGIPA